MKQFPRLHSLVTLGIRQHQEFDYHFHGFRTDFVGDSGSGKSMIADLLQLVFVGSEVFYSPTDALEEREVDGMILKTAGKGTDMAYVVVNIESNPGQYLAIGAYLESINKQSRSFILQQSYNEDELHPLHHPLKCRDLLVDDQIPTLDAFKRTMEESGVIYHGFNPRRKLHAFLLKHSILNIDLTSQPVLKDYATIIQSFSRGKSLDVGKSDSLKDFLFGPDKAKEIRDKYKKAVDDLQASLKEFAVNQQELTMATVKYNAVQELRNMQIDYSLKQEDWIVKYCAYLSQEVVESLNSLQDSCRQYIDNTLSVRAIQQLIQREMAAEQNENSRLKEQSEAAKSVYDQTLLRKDKVAPVFQLMKRLECTVDELIMHYREYHTRKIQKELIERVAQELTSKGIYPLALKIDSLHDLESVIRQLDEQLAMLQNEYGHRSSFAAFVKGNDQGTLGRWFSQHYAPQSRVAESILMFYKGLPVEQAPANADQYISSPTVFLKDASVGAEDDKGFWLSNGELRQYIPFIEESLFTAEDTATFQALLEQMSRGVDEELLALKLKIKQHQQLKSYVITTPDFMEFIKLQATADHTQLNIFVEDKGFDISDADLGQGIALLDDYGQIMQDYETADKAWQGAIQSESDYRNFLKALGQVSTQLTNRAEGSSAGQMVQKVSSLFVEFRVTDAEVLRRTNYLNQQYQKAADKATWISANADNVLQSFKYADMGKQIDEYNILVERRARAFKEGRLTLAKEPDITPYRLVLLTDPRTEQQAYEVAKTLYQTRFTYTAKTYAPGDAHKFDNNFNFLELTKAVLPDAFLSEEAQEDNFIDQIEKYFTQINEKNKTLNSRKLHRIKEILDDVDDEVERRLDTVRKIHLFLNDADREITGGHRASLRHEANPGFPRKWIQDYIEKLNNEETLFNTGQTLNDLLKDNTSLQDKMIAAFYAFGGHKGAKATVEKLLDPNTYFKLAFTMESQATGKNNSGSTGQTYAATALLCIARLSLVNKNGFSKDPTRSIRFMPIDEAEGLGSNFDMLHEIARKFDYQILTMSINPLGRFRQGEQYIYILSNNKAAGEDVNYPPMGIFSDADRTTITII